MTHPAFHSETSNVLMKTMFVTRVYVSVTLPSPSEKVACAVGGFPNYLNHILTMRCQSKVNIWLVRFLISVPKVPLNESCFSGDVCEDDLATCGGTGRCECMDGYVANRRQCGMTLNSMYNKSLCSLCYNLLLLKTIL